MRDEDSARRPRTRRGGKREFGGPQDFGSDFAGFGGDFGDGRESGGFGEQSRDRNDRGGSRGGNERSAPSRSGYRGGLAGGDRGAYGGGASDRGAYGGGGGGGYRGGSDEGGFKPRPPRPDSAPMERGPRQPGVVKFFKADKGFGFVTPDSGEPDVFVHISAVERSGLTTLDSGQRVSFETEPDRRGKGPKAVELKLEEENA